MGSSIKSIRKDSKMLFVDSLSSRPMVFMLPSMDKSNVLEALITTNGGKVTKNYSKHAIRLSSYPDEESVHIAYIRDCINESKLLNMNDYKGSFYMEKPSPMKKKRNKFTPEEDAAILKYVKENSSDSYMSTVRGNVIWKKMEKENIVKHPWQSLRGRYLNYLINIDNYTSVSAKPSRDLNLSMTDEMETSSDNYVRALKKSDRKIKTRQTNVLSTSSSNECIRIKKMNSSDNNEWEESNGGIYSDIESEARLQKFVLNEFGTNNNSNMENKKFVEELLDEMNISSLEDMLSDFPKAINHVTLDSNFTLNKYPNKESKPVKNEDFNLDECVLAAYNQLYEERNVVKTETFSNSCKLLDKINSYETAASFNESIMALYDSSKESNINLDDLSFVKRQHSNNDFVQLFQYYTDSNASKDVLNLEGLMKIPEPCVEDNVVEYADQSDIDTETDSPKVLYSRKINKENSLNHMEAAVSCFDVSSNDLPHNTPTEDTSSDIISPENTTSVKEYQELIEKYGSIEEKKFFDKDRISIATTFPYDIPARCKLMDIIQRSSYKSNTTQIFEGCKIKVVGSSKKGKNNFPDDSKEAVENKLQKVDENEHEFTLENKLQIAVKNKVQKANENELQRANENELQKADENELQKADENELQNSVESKLQNAVEIKVQKAVESKIQKAVENKLQKAVENKLQKTVENKLQQTECELKGTILRKYHIRGIIDEHYIQQNDGKFYKKLNISHVMNREKIKSLVSHYLNNAGINKKQRN